MINRKGYACINMTLREEGIIVGRKMIRKTFLEKGIAWASKLALRNVQDMDKIIRWNLEHGILAYRMSSSMFPWMSEYEIKDLPDYPQIALQLRETGRFAITNHMRLSFHPGAFTILSSPKQSVVDKAIKELNQHSEIMDLLGCSPDTFSKINIHVGGTYGDKEATLKRFVENFRRLNIRTQKRLTVENDDRPSMYTVEDLMYIHNNTGNIKVPIVFDFHHYDCHPGQLSKLESLDLALSTWGSMLPMVHMSSSRRLHEDNSAKTVAHADYLYEEVPSTGKPFDVMMETKAKELAVLRYQEEFELIKS